MLRACSFGTSLTFSPYSSVVFAVTLPAVAPSTVLRVSSTYYKILVPGPATGNGSIASQVSSGVTFGSILVSRHVPMAPERSAAWVGPITSFTVVLVLSLRIKTVGRVASASFLETVSLVSPFSSCNGSKRVVPSVPDSPRFLGGSSWP